MAEESILQDYEYRMEPAPLFSTVHWHDIKVELEKQISFLQSTRRCARCRKSFSIWDSMGRWECSKHTGELVDTDDSGKNGVWACCGKHEFSYRPAEKRGCLRCDHIAHTVDNNKETFTLRADLYQVMPVARIGRAVDCQYAYNRYTGEYSKERSHVVVRVSEPLKYR